MAEYGFETYREDGGLQISSDNMSFALRYKGTIVLDGPNQTPPGSPTATFRTKSITLTCDTPILATTSATYDAAVITTNNGDGTYTFTFYAESGHTTSVDYFVFDLPKYGIGDNFGFEVFDANGNLTWFAGQYVLNVVGVMDGYSGSTSVPSGKRYAAVTSSPKSAAVGARTTLFLSNIRASSTEVLWGGTIPITNPDSGTAIPQGIAGQGSGFIIDITNY